MLGSRFFKGGLKPILKKQDNNLFQSHNQNKRLLSMILTMQAVFNFQLTTTN